MKRDDAKRKAHRISQAASKAKRVATHSTRARLYGDEVRVYAFWRKSMLQNREVML